MLILRIPETRRGCQPVGSADARSSLLCQLRLSDRIVTPIRPDSLISGHLKSRRFKLVPLPYPAANTGEEIPRLVGSELASVLRRVLESLRGCQRRGHLGVWKRLNPIAFRSEINKRRQYGEATPSAPRDTSQ